MDISKVGPRPRALFSKFLLEHPEGDRDQFVAFRARHADEGEALDALFEEVERLRKFLDLPARSIARHLEEVYGPDADPRIELDESITGPVDPDADFDLLAHLPEARGDGRYRVRGEVARGGMGSILKVWDRDLRRHLAMKVALESSASRGSSTAGRLNARALARFLEEAQITGQLDHPGVVPVHELGLDGEGRVYFTMRLVRGRDMQRVFELVDEHEEGWTVVRAIGVLLRVCEAVAYAHNRGVIHRDLKPSNVMVGRFGEVYVMDWGLARVLGRSSAVDEELLELSGTFSRIDTLREDLEGEESDSPITQAGEVVGTPAYMSPEQADGRIEEMGPASDVYSVGAILYRLLAGHRPYHERGTRRRPADVLRAIALGSPSPIAQSNPSAPPELVAVCEKAMARQAEDRYASMEAMAHDLRAFTEGRVVAAYRTGPAAELRKWVGRNRAVAAITAAALAVVLFVSLRSAVVQAGTNRRLTSAQAQLIALSSLDMAEGSPSVALGMALSAADVSPYLARTAILNALPSLTQDALLPGVSPVTVGGDDLLAAWDPKTEQVRIWSLTERDWIESFAPPSDAGVSRMALSEDGQTLVCACASTGAAFVLDRGSRTWTELARGAGVPAHDGPVHSVLVFDGGVSALTSSTDRTARLWDIATRELVHTFEGHTGAVTHLAVSPDGTILATGSGSLAVGVLTDLTVRLWDVESGELLHVLEGYADEINAICFHPSRPFVVTGAGDGTVRVHRLDDGVEVAGKKTYDERVLDVAIHPSGDLLAVGLERGFELLELSGTGAIGESTVPQRGREWAHDGRAVSHVAFEPGGSRLLTCGSDLTARLWKIYRAGESRGARAARRTRIESSFVAKGHTTWIHGARWSPDGRRFVTWGREGVRVWMGIGSVSSLFFQPDRARITSVAIWPDASLIVFGNEAGHLQGSTFDPLRDYEPFTFVRAGPPDSPQEGGYATAMFDWEAHETLVVVWNNGWVERFEPRSQRILGTTFSLGGPVESAHFDRESGLLLAAMAAGDMVVCNLAGDSTPRRLAIDGRVRCARVRPGGELVCVGTQDGFAHLFWPATGRIAKIGRLPELTKHQADVFGVDFHPTREELVLSCADGRLRFYDLAADPPRELEELRSSARPTTGSVHYLRDGERLVVTRQWWGAVSEYDTRTETWSNFTLGGEPHQHANAITATTFDRASGSLVTTSYDKSAILWDTDAREPLGTFRHRSPILCCAVSADGEWAVTGDSVGQVRVWPLDPIAVGRRLESGDSPPVPRQVAERDD